MGKIEVVVIQRAVDDRDCSRREAGGRVGVANEGSWWSRPAAAEVLAVALPLLCRLLLVTDVVYRSAVSPWYSKKPRRRLLRVACITGR